MLESEYQALYRLFHAFTACSNKATRSVSGNNEVAECPENRFCYTTDGANLFLCEDCLKFWHECRRVGDRSMWQMAVFLRESRVDRQSEP
jgi:hypothetical protein